MAAATPSAPRGAALVFAERQFGGALNEDERNPIINLAVEEILGGDPERVLVFILNLSADTVHVGLRNTVSATNGIILAASGGSVSFNAIEDGTLPTRQFFGIAAGVGAQLYILTLRRETQVARGEIL